MLPNWLLLLLLAVVGILYSVALPGLLLFDDDANLYGLSDVSDSLSAIVFVLAGDAGPLGRPLAMATFAAQASAWPDNTAAFLIVNIGVHLLATLAAYLLAYGLACFRLPASQARWAGLAVAALWGLSPFLATTHLMIIQRMAGLSGLFVIAGLAAFTWAHLLVNSRPWLARGFLILGLGGGTVLAVLSKENGALLPLFALVVLWLWIPRGVWLRSATDSMILITLAVLPALALLVYLGSRVPGVIEMGYPYRDFSPAERLLSQPAILIDYVRNLLLPRVATVSPFMDALPAPSGWFDPPATAVSAGLWGVVLALAWWLRRVAGYLLFGLVFFLVGHLIESGFIGLELYFAHRNYVSAFGLYFALVMAAYAVPRTYRRLAVLGLTVYVLLFAIVLHQAAVAWSEPRLSAEIWLIENPSSERAAQFLANQYLAEGDARTAARVINLAATYREGRAALQVQRTQNCVDQEHMFDAVLDEVVESLRTAHHQISAAIEVAAAVQRPAPPDLCPPRDFEAVDRMVNALLDNPRYVRHRRSHALLLFSKGVAEARRGHANAAVDLFIRSFERNRHLDTALYAATVMAMADQIELAEVWLDEVKEHAPSNMFERNTWYRRIDVHLEQLREMGSATQGDQF